MLEVKFYDTIEDEKLGFAVILSKTQGKWIFCRHRERTTYEFPGGHREKDEIILDTAKRELYEETGALSFLIQPIGVYSVSREGAEESFGKFYYAEIKEFEKELHSEIEEIIITDVLPENWTYPLIQPKLLEYAKMNGFI